MVDKKSKNGMLSTKKDKYDKSVKHRKDIYRGVRKYGKKK